MRWVEKRPALVRRVLYSALTTIGSVGSQVVSGHPGMVSMGCLLTIAIGYTWITTLPVLPSLIDWASPHRLSET